LTGLLRSFWIVPFIICVLVLFTVPAQAQTSSDFVSQCPTPVDENDWLGQLNQFRCETNLPEVRERYEWSNGSAKIHSDYMAQTDDFTHARSANEEGLIAAANSYLGKSGARQTNTNFVRRWFNSHSHSDILLSPGLQVAGYAKICNLNYCYATLQWADNSMGSFSRGDVTYPADGANILAPPDLSNPQWLHVSWASAMAQCPCSADVRVNGQSFPLGTPDSSHGETASIIASGRGVVHIKLASGIPANSDVSVTVNTNNGLTRSWRFSVQKTNAIQLTATPYLMAGERYGSTGTRTGASSSKFARTKLSFNGIKGSEVLIKRSNNGQNLVEVKAANTGTYTDNIGYLATDTTATRSYTYEACEPDRSICSPPVTVTYPTLTSTAPNP
jgi:hypothetical protein